MILIEKIIENNDIEFNYKFFEDLEYHIHNYLIIIENYYSKYKINEYLRIIILKIKKLILNNKQLLLYNSYLDVENYLQNNKFDKSQKKYFFFFQTKTKNNLNEFIDDFFNIKDDKLQKYYDKPTTEEFIDNDQFIFSEYEDNDKKGDFSKNPKQVNAIINYMKEVSKDINDNYIEIIIDFISSKIYDCLINHKPDNEDIKLFNELIKDHLHYELDGKIDIEERVMKNIRFNMKKFEKLPGIYQKILSFQELLSIFNEYNSFVKGRNEMMDIDEKKTYMKYIINRLYAKSLNIICKYISLFEGGYRDICPMLNVLVSILFDLKENYKYE